MPEIQNTTEFVKDGGAYLILADAMAGKSTDQIIGDMEGAGQRQLVASSLLPTEIRHPWTAADFAAVGFDLGEVVDGDPLFRHATLPAGWVKRGSDHDMWSCINDELGRERVAIFYKAAFYDRRAFMRLVDVHGYVWACKHDGAPVVTDETWATAAAVAESARELARSAEESIETWSRAIREGRSVDHATERVSECEAERDAYLAIATQFEGGE
jgi:hypothetical protein